MIDWFIVTLWFELNDKLFMKHYPNQLVSDCKTAVVELMEVYEEKYPLREFRAAKCNRASDWARKYIYNDWDKFLYKKNK